jgi:purine-binding chemotaxis protein CheW
MDMLVFELAGSRYAIALDRVREVVRAVSITPIPGAPRAVAGVINVRGTAVPVYDLAERFGAPAHPLRLDERFIVARGDRRIVALRVDRVEWIRAVQTGDVEDASGLVSRTPYITGVARLADGLLLIHDLDSFLSAAEAGELETSMRDLQMDGTG